MVILVGEKIENILVFLTDLDTISVPIILKEAAIFKKNNENGTSEIQLNIGLDYYIRQ